MVIKLTGEERAKRGRELAPARVFAFNLWKEKPKITSDELAQALKETGFEVAEGTRNTWLRRFNKGKGIHTYSGNKKPSKVHLKQIIEAVGSVEALSLLFFQGVMEELKKRDVSLSLLKSEVLEKDEAVSSLKNELEGMTKERNKVLREFNETMSALKVGTLTIDQVTLKLIPERSG